MKINREAWENFVAALLWRCGPLIGNGYLSHMTWGTSFFIFFIGNVMPELTLGHSEFKTSHIISSKTFVLKNDFYPWKGGVGGAIQNGSTKNIKMKFFGYLTKNIALGIFVFRFSVLCQRTVRGIKRTLFLGWDELGSLGLRGISRTLNTIAKNPELRNAMFFVGYPKNIISNFSIEPFGMILFPG